ncbi:MAG: LPS export ABC transporter permease LptF [Desulfovibrionales bacterium]|nr:LPS export ABC transporter permease LptF [Desulfovibrionales bacterium]
MKTIHQYILKELLVPFFISLFFLTFVFLMTRIPEITKMVVNYHAGMSTIFMLVIYTLPRFLEFTIPMSVMISVLLTFMRMSGENEIIALKGAGTSLYKLLPPVVIFCVMGTLMGLWVTLYGVSWGKLSIKKTTIELARTSIDVALKERQFNSKLTNIMIYVAHVDPQTKDMTDIFIEDRRNKGLSTISVAPKGRLIQSGDGSVYTLRLYDGMINQVKRDNRSVSAIHFATYDINIDLEALGRGSKTLRKSFDEQSLGELWGKIQSGIKDPGKLSAALMVFHEKFSIPFACLSLGLLGFPLGIQSLSLRKSSGFGMGIFFFLLYYLFLAAGWSAGEAGYFPPVIGMWFPNVIMGGAGIFLLMRNAKEKPVHMPAWVGRLVGGILKKLARGKRA